MATQGRSVLHLGQRSGALRALLRGRHRAEGAEPHRDPGVKEAVLAADDGGGRLQLAHAWEDLKPIDDGTPSGRSTSSSTTRMAGPRQGRGQRRHVHDGARAPRALARHRGLRPRSRRLQHRAHAAAGPRRQERCEVKISCGIVPSLDSVEQATLAEELGTTVPGSTTPRRSTPTSGSRWPASPSTPTGIGLGTAVRCPASGASSPRRRPSAPSRPWLLVARCRLRHRCHRRLDPLQGRPHPQGDRRSSCASSGAC